jgi:RNA polymerase sigma-70 factor (ECF subfamily)
MINDIHFKSGIAKSDQRKFKQLIEITSDELLLFAIGFVRNKEVAEEIVSDIYVKIWNNRSEIENILNLKSYLFICVRI